VTFWVVEPDTNGTYIQLVQMFDPRGYIPNWGKQWIAKKQADAITWVVDEIKELKRESEF